MTYRGSPEATERLQSLANRMKAIRETQGMTIEDLARASGVSMQTIKRFEQYGEPAKFTALREIANVLGYDLEFRLNTMNE